MNIFSQLWGYCKLYYKLNLLYNEYTVHETVDTDYGHNLIDLIHTDILNNGAICIKFCQWLLPILDNVYIKDGPKPYWFTSLENLYENCPIHSHEYSKQIYVNEFNEDFDDDYILLDVIGSGSIGQVYKIRNKHNQKEFAYKIIHPDVKYQLQLFKKVLTFLLKFPCVAKKLHELVPVNYLQFIDIFEEQINMIKESNNLTRVNYYYKDNSSVIIPQLIRCSERCLLMTYEEGVTLEKLDVSDYRLTKIISLLYGFITTNQLFCDVMHNDIHKGNWKVRKLKEDRYAIVVYDFGFCGKGNLKNRPIIEKMTTMFECSDENTDNTENYVSMTQFFCNDYSDGFKSTIYQHIPDDIVCNPNDLFDLGINVCRGGVAVLDAKCIQILIISIQCYKYLAKAFINNDAKLKNDGYRTYREKYLDLCNIYKTYDCFHEYREYMLHKLSTLDIEVTGLFDTIKDNETVTDEITKLLKFD